MGRQAGRQGKELMKTHFAEVLARESARLAGITDGAKLSCWQRKLVEELMTPDSPYARALRQTGGGSDRAEFLDRWRALIEDAVRELVHRRAMGASDSASGPPDYAADVDPRKTAVLVLAALHGGSTLSQIAKNSWPLNAALDLALAPFKAPSGPDSGEATCDPNRSVP